MMNQIENKCNNKKCPQWKTCCRLPTEYQVRHDTDILFYGIGAGKKEEELKRPFVGPAGRRLKYIIKWVMDNHGPFTFALSNNVRFHPKDEKGRDRAPTKEEMDICINHLTDDILYLLPSAIMPLGLVAYNTFIDDRPAKSVAEMHGKVRYDVFGDMLYVGTYHPSWIIRQVGSGIGSNFPTDQDKILIKDISDTIDLIRKREQRG